MERIDPENLKGAKRLWSDFLKDDSSSGNPPSGEQMATGLRTLLAAGALYASAPTEATARDIQTKPHVERRAESEQLSRADFEILAKNVFHEAKGESPEGQLAVAQVTFARLLTKRWGETLRAIVYAKHQFTWTNNESKEAAHKLSPSLKHLADVFASSLKGRAPKDIVAQLSQITGLPPETLYYKRADWDENDPNETRMSERTKEVFRSLVWVKNIGNHAFYKDPVKTAQKR